VPPRHSDAAAVDLSIDPDDELPIDLMNDSFFLDGVARIMAEARARGVGPTPAQEDSAGSQPDDALIP